MTHAATISQCNMKLQCRGNVLDFNDAWQSRPFNVLHCQERNRGKRVKSLVVVIFILSCHLFDMISFQQQQILHRWHPCATGTHIAPVHLLVPVKVHVSKPPP